MPNTYTQIHIQLVFAVKYRAALIEYHWEDKLYKYITKIIQKHGHKMLQINGMPDHIHIFFGMRPIQNISELVKEIKEDSSGWINRNGLSKTHFRWQGGFGAFSYSMSHVQRVCQYVANQKEHHRKKSFRKEYKELLDHFEIEYDDQYTFKDLE